MKSPESISRRTTRAFWQIVSPEKAQGGRNHHPLPAFREVGDFEPGRQPSRIPRTSLILALNSPTARSTFKTKSGISFTLLVGNGGMAGSSTYVKTGEKNTVYLLPNYGVDNLKKPLNNYRDHTYIKTDSVLAKKIQVTHAGKLLSLEKDKDNAWKITEPTSRIRPMINKVRDLLNTVSGLRAEDFVADNPSGLSTYGLAKPPRESGGLAQRRRGAKVDPDRP